MSRNPIAAGNHEKAWNDPPQMAFKSSNCGQPTSNRLRMMKKRIPVPINSPGSPIPISSQDIKLTPPVSAPPKDVVIGKVFGEDEKEVTREPSFENTEVISISEVDEVLTKALNEFTPLESSETLSKKEVENRLNSFQELWGGDRLRQEVKLKMSSLIKALRDKNFIKAWELHQSLMVDYTSECSNWMLGFKTLILVGRDNLELKNTPDTTEEWSNQSGCNSSPSGVPIQ